MRNLLFSLLLSFVFSLAYADDKPWNDQTRDAAYEAPNSLLQKKWMAIYNGMDGVYEFLANGTFKYTTFSTTPDGVNVSIVQSGSYKRSKDILTTTIINIKLVPNKTDLANLSARKRDETVAALKQTETKFSRENINKKFTFLILRLDDECLIFSDYDPASKIFNDMRWTTCYNETHQAKEAEREALRRAEQARLDSIRIVEEKARREAEEKAKRYNPTFKEGDVSEWIAKNMQYPRVAAENGISGRVNVGFVVECDGSISHVQVLRGVDPSLDKEAVRLVRSMPKWNPGMQNGEPIRMEYNVPVQFKLR